MRLLEAKCIGTKASNHYTDKDGVGLEVTRSPAQILRTRDAKSRREAFILSCGERKIIRKNRP